MGGAITTCRRCINSTANPSVQLGSDGLCGVCAAYAAGFNAGQLDRERLALGARAGRTDGPHDALVGLSGGKDSTATLVETLRLGLRPLAVTFDTGYYPAHIITRSARLAAQLGVPHVVVDVRPYMRPSTIQCYRQTARLYDRPPGVDVFRALYRLGRRHYSATCEKVLPYVRTCQLCRRTIVFAYYQEARRRGVDLVVLGMNEWVRLSRMTFSAVRHLQPLPGVPAVDIVHLPYLLRWRLADTLALARNAGWAPPVSEDVVSGNANSCLLARASEATATRLLGFHPDSTRLAREVTAGFLSRDQAAEALRQPHTGGPTVRDVLQAAGVLAPAGGTANSPQPRAQQRRPGVSDGTGNAMGASPAAEVRVGGPGNLTSDPGRAWTVTTP